MAADLADSNVSGEDGAGDEDPDEPTLLPENTPVPETAENLDDLFADALRPPTSTDSTPSDVVSASDSCGLTSNQASNAVHHMRKHRKARRLAKRQREAVDTPGTQPFKKAALKYLQNSSALQTEGTVAAALTQDVNTAPPLSTPIQTDCSLDMADLPVTANAFTAKLYAQTDADRRAVPVSELRDREGWQYISWDGRCVPSYPSYRVGPVPHRLRNCRTCHSLLDRNGFVIGDLAGQPKWGDINDTLIKIFEKTKSAYTFTAGEREHRRGNFPSISTGISFGGGQKVSFLFVVSPMAMLSTCLPSAWATSHTRHTIKPSGML